MKKLIFLIFLLFLSCAKPTVVEEKVEVKEYTIFITYFDLVIPCYEVKDNEPFCTILLQDLANIITTLNKCKKEKSPMCI